MSTYITGLSAKGSEAMREFLLHNLRDESLIERQWVFEDAVYFDADSGHYELNRQLSKSGNPVTISFRGDELATEVQS